MGFSDKYFNRVLLLINMKKELLKKSVVFRIYSIIIIALFFYIVTGSLKQMTFFTVFVEAIKTVQYVVFEVFWEKYKKNKKKIKKSFEK